MNGFLDTLLGYRPDNGILTVDAVLLCLLATFLLAQVVAWVYLRTHQGVSYSSTMARSLIVLALIVALVMMVIGNNIVRAFGLFGALALIRFRTPVKDANDTVYLFFAVAIGIATGTGNILAGAIGTAIISLVILYLARIRFGNPLNYDGLLRFRLPVTGLRDEVVREILGRYCDSFKMLHMKETEAGATLELVYEIQLADPRYSTAMVAEIEGLDDVSGLSLLMQDLEAAP